MNAITNLYRNAADLTVTADAFAAVLTPLSVMPKRQLVELAENMGGFTVNRMTAAAARRQLALMCWDRRNAAQRAAMIGE